MAEYKVAQAIFPKEKYEFTNGWSGNLLAEYNVGFARQIGIHAMPGTKIYIGPFLENNEQPKEDGCLIIGPSGIFQLNAEEGYLMMDVRLSKESYDLAAAIGQYIVFDFIGTYAPGNANGEVVIYNGGGVRI